MRASVCPDHRGREKPMPGLCIGTAAPPRLLHLAGGASYALGNTRQDMSNDRNRRIPRQGKTGLDHRQEDRRQVSGASAPGSRCLRARTRPFSAVPSASPEKRRLRDRPSLPQRPLRGRSSGLAFEDRLTALDKITGECRISLQNKYPVSDPALSEPGNVCLRAFLDDFVRTVSARAALTGSGSAVKLFISCARLPA